MVRYLEDEEPSVDDCVLPCVKRHNLVTPVLCGTRCATRVFSVLLDAVVYYLPSPLDVPPLKG
jgi:elongation factor G